jgi:hypothetical protein
MFILACLTLPGLADDIIAARPQSAESEVSASGGARLASEHLRIGHIDFVVHSVYSQQELDSVSGLLRFAHESLNALHTRTRKHVLRRELLFAPGDELDLGLLAETERNLRDLGFLSNVSVVPVDTLPDGTVDIEVRVQDTWSLKTNFSYSRASDRSQRWNVLLTESNFLGQGMQVGGGWGETEDFPFRQLEFRKRHLGGTPWQLDLFVSELGDGHANLVSVRRPFYAEDDAWSWESYAYRDRAERRFYLSNAGPAGQDPARLASLYVTLPVKNEGGGLSYLWRVSEPRQGRIWRLGLGVEIQHLGFDLADPDLELSDGRPADLAFLAQGETPVVRDQGSLLFPHLIVATRGRSWFKGSFLMQYGPVEDVPLQPSFKLRIGPCMRQGEMPTVGNGRRARLNLSYEDWNRLGGGMLLVRGTSQSVWGGKAERTAQTSLTAAWLRQQQQGRWLWLSRFFAEGGWGDRLLGTEAFILGLNRGLRTLGYDSMAGDRLVRWNTEQGLVLPFELLGFYRTGLAAFYSGGIAWWRGEEHGPEDVRHELGIGLRFGPTRSAHSEVARLDVTWDLGGSGGPVVTAVTRGLF